MLTLGLVILLCVAIANIVLGTLVLLKDTHNKVNITFFIFVISVVLWTVFNYATDHYLDLQWSLWFARLANVFGLMSVYLFWQFTKIFVEGDKKYKITTDLPVLIIGTVLALSPFAVKEVTGFEEAAIQELGAAYAIVILAMFFCFGGAIKVLIQGMRHSKDKFFVRNIRLILVGLTLTFTFAIITNIFLPIFTRSWNVSQLGPVFTLILVLSVAIGIVRNKLFNIKPIIARSFAYIASLMVLGLAYGFVTFILLDKVIGANSVDSSTENIIYTTLAMLFGLTFSPLKRLFDKLSEKIFYRDSYKPQGFIDDFTKLVVTKSEATSLLKASSDMLTYKLKASFVEFILDRKIDIRKESNNIDIEDDFGGIIELMNQLSKKLVIVSEIEGHRQKALKDKLLKKNVALIVKISNPQQEIGVMLIGDKQSGNTFNPNDLEVIRIVADELSLALQNSLRFEEIKAFNKTLQNEVDDATKRLRSSNAKLKSLDETKDEFISMASHQLRTPLTSVKGYLSMVLEGDAGELNEQQHKLLTQAFISSQRMVYLIADLLNVSRLRTGKFLIETEPTYLPDVVEGELNQLRETAEAKGLKLHFDKPGEFPMLKLDETKIRQVVMNFADNAIYYTPAGGKITVSLEATSRAVEFKVTDTGLGVPKADQHKLFAKFYRADNAKRARPDGTGLGLYMARKVIVAQGGAIIFKSVEGKGSTFGFVFPRSKVEVQSTKD